MAKRFIETGIFRKRLLRGLDAPSKLLWIYYITECDHAGVWDTANLDIDSIILGHDYTIEGVMKALGDRVILVDGKLFMPDFIRYQYGELLNPNNRVHASVIKRLDKLKIDPNTLAPSKPLASPLLGAKDKDKDKEKDKDKDKVQDKEKVQVQETVHVNNNVRNNVRNEDEEARMDGRYKGLPHWYAEIAERVDKLKSSWVASPNEWRENSDLQHAAFERRASIESLSQDDWRKLRWLQIEAESNSDCKVTAKRNNLVREINDQVARADTLWSAAGKPSLKSIGPAKINGVGI